MLPTAASPAGFGRTLSDRIGSRSVHSSERSSPEAGLTLPLGLPFHHGFAKESADSGGADARENDRRRGARPDVLPLGDSGAAASCGFRAREVRYRDRGDARSENEGGV